MIAPADDGLPEPVPRDDRTSPPAPLSTQPNQRGNYAGFASRFIAFVFDSAISIGVFMLVLSAASFAASVLTGSSIHWTASGQTPGMTLLGVQVVGKGGSNVGTQRGLVRTLAFPLSFLLLGLGFIGILLSRDRRALHDSIAGTEVVYAWDARAARLRFLAREGNGRRS
jgi:uncharacterized RDD family membrane protein YckC